MVNVVPMMPEEYKGDMKNGGGYTTTSPRKWTKEEIEWCTTLREKGFNSKEIAQSVDRSEVSVSIKLKRLTKKKNTYNEVHVEDKYNTNIEFINLIKPRTVLDVFCGVKSFYKNSFNNLKVTTNDKDESVEADFHLDALKLMCYQYYNGKSYDFIDLDPYGSASECFDLAIKMANKGIAITLGEIGHKRWKRLDYVRRHYGIESLDDFNSENLVKEIIKIGEKHKKILTPVFLKDWKNISRVWFKIEPLKITEQWD